MNTLLRVLRLLSLNAPLAVSIGLKRLATNAGNNPDRVPTTIVKAMNKLQNAVKKDAIEEAIETEQSNDEKELELLTEIRDLLKK